MHAKRIGVLIGVVVLAGLFWPYSKRAEAQNSPPPCSLQSLSGAYTYALNGSYFDNQGNEYGFSSAGRLVADGNGNFIGRDTASDGAVITRGRQYSGTYTVNADCSGSAVFSISGSALHLDFVVTNNLQNVNFIQTDNGTDIAGTAQQQFH